MIKRYIKKAVAVSAMQWKGAESSHDLMVWCEAIGGSRRIEFAEEHALIRTLEGDMRADPGDYIICGVKGELYPCKPDIFHMTYQLIEREAPADALERIADTTGARTQVQLAELLEIQQPSISDAKRRGAIPDSWLITLLRKFNLNPVWIVTGTGTRYLAPADKQ